MWKLALGVRHFVQGVQPYSPLIKHQIVYTFFLGIMTHLELTITSAQRELLEHVLLYITVSMWMSQHIYLHANTKRIIIIQILTSILEMQTYLYTQTKPPESTQDRQVGPEGNSLMTMCDLVLIKQKCQN